MKAAKAVAEGPNANNTVPKKQNPPPTITVPMEKAPVNAEPGIVVHIPPPAEKKPVQRRQVKRPAKYLDEPPLKGAKSRGPTKKPLKPRTHVWILHPGNPGNAVAKGISASHWRSHAKTKSILNIKGVDWECEMQMVTIELVFQDQSTCLYPNRQRPGINTVSDSLWGAFSKDKTILWETNYLVPIVKARDA